MLDRPLATASVSFRLEGGVIRSPRIVLGHVAPTPWIATAAEKAIDGKSFSAELAEQAERLLKGTATASV